MRFVALFLLAWSALAAPPTPASWFGHPIGADRTVLDWDKVVGYFQALAKSSDRIRVEELGKTAEGRPFIAATIADPETLRHLDRYIAIQQRLADPRKTTPAEAERLLPRRQDRGADHLLDPRHRDRVHPHGGRVRLPAAHRGHAAQSRHPEGHILLLVPSLNPDGVDIVTRWYRKTLGTPYEGTAPPELYHKYVGHDNNRDWYIFSQPETRLTISKLHNVWHPEIVYDVHQHGPNAARLFVPPWLDPTEPNIDPILMQEMNMIGTAMAADLTAAGKTGVAIHAVYDFWTPSRHYQAFHGGLRILTESASARIASPITVTADQIAHDRPGLQPARALLELSGAVDGRRVALARHHRLPVDRLGFAASTTPRCIATNCCAISIAWRERQVARTEPWGFVISAEPARPRRHAQADRDAALRAGGSRARERMAAR